VTAVPVIQWLLVCAQIAVCICVFRWIVKDVRAFLRELEL
jgi:hypothetical protein